MTILQVAVGVIKDSEGKILISLRHESSHQGGLWEFPGGKIEASETAEFALARELKEELDITVISATPLITINHQYPDLSVQLKVYLVEQFLGEAQGCEGQYIKWIMPAEFEQYDFPAANQSIITAARLPPYYAILDDDEPILLLSNLQKILNSGIKLIQARLKNLPVAEVTRFIEHAYPLCKQQQALLLMNAAVDYAGVVDGLHLTGHHLMALERRPEQVKLLAASCHNVEQLMQAQNLGVDFVVLGPVMATKTHPEASSLGWTVFADFVARINIPVYALGGMAADCLPIARQSGGQGIAAIRAFLD